MKSNIHRHEICVKKSEDNSNIEDNQNTIILDDTDYLQHFRALVNQISLRKNAYVSFKQSRCSVRT